MDEPKDNVIPLFKDQPIKKPEARPEVGHDELMLRGLYPSKVKLIYETEEDGSLRIIIERDMYEGGLRAEQVFDSFDLTALEWIEKALRALQKRDI